MSGAAFNTVQYVVLCAVSLAVVIKLARTSLAGRYKALLSFLFFMAFYYAVILFFLEFRSGNFNSRAYMNFWEITQPLMWLFSVWMTLELYSLILERHKGLATFGRWVQYAGLGLSTLISLVVMLPQFQSKGINPIALYYYSIDRGIDCGMLVFLLFILIWLTQYPVPLSRNVVVHSFVYSTLFFTNSLGMFTQMFFGFRLTQVLTSLLIGIFGLCLLAWLVLLTPKGEEIRVTVPRFSAEHEALVLEKLETLNRTLLQIARK